MKAFIVRYGSQDMTIPAGNATVVISIYHHKGNSFSHIESFGIEEPVRSVWHNGLVLQPGDKVEVELVETNVSSVPAEVMSLENKPVQTTKLELFRRIEENLKSRGVI